MNDYIEHHGVKGQRWGVRKYVDENGKLTDIGKKKYAEKEREQKAKIESKKSKQEYRQEKHLRDQAARHDAAKRRGRVLAVAALTAVGVVAAKNIMNNIRSNKLKLLKGETDIKFRDDDRRKNVLGFP